MSETLREIVKKNNNIFTFSIDKKDEFDRYTWDYTITDKDSKRCGESDKMINHRYRIVTLRRDEHFFLAYKFDDDDSYYVDIRKANHRSSVPKYIDSLVDYYIKSNDISYKKDDSSFKVSERKMKRLGIGNFLDLCYYFREYSAIGIGLTRDVRNLIVLDIDVDCRKKENHDELNRLLKLFAINNMIPDFEIHNNSNGHIQLQWLIRSHIFKKRCNEYIGELIRKLTLDKNKNCEISNEFIIKNNLITEIDEGVQYKILTKSMTHLSKFKKFGDESFTFWKAKNFCTALFGLQNLELKMPQYRNGEIIYLRQDEMVDLFSTKEKRYEYYNEAPTFEDIVLKSKPFLEEHIEEEKKVSNDSIDDCFDDDGFEKIVYVNSRNNFVFQNTRKISWEIFRQWNLKSIDDIIKLSSDERSKLESIIRKKVLKEYNILNKKYNYKWPGTSNNAPFSNKEFSNAFDRAYTFAIAKFRNTSKYSDEQRENSMIERGLKKKMKLIVVDYLRSENVGIKRDDLFDLVNKTLERSHQKKISLSSLKRYIDVSKSMSDEERKTLYRNYFENLKERESDVSNNVDNNFKKKRLDYISINIIDNIMKKYKYETTCK